MKPTLFVLLSLFSASFVQAQMTDRGVIESPSAFVSGIGFISGWKCNTNDIELWLTGSAREGVLKLNPAQNMPRSDTAGVCLGEENNGFIIQVNWNELIGYDTVVARDNGEAFDSRSFTIGHTGLPFVNDKGGTEVEVVDFPSPDTATTLTWSTATQHFEVSGTEDIPPCTEDACEGSGEGAIIRTGSGEGWTICKPASTWDDSGFTRHESTITCEYREKVPTTVDTFLDDDGCFKGEAQDRDPETLRPYPGTNWYVVTEWSISYGFITNGRWNVIRQPFGLRARPIADDVPGTWNQQWYRDVPFDDQAFYHLQQSPSPDVKAGTHASFPNDIYSYTQFQFYALGPVSWEEDEYGRPRACFRNIPQAPAP